MKLFSIGHSNAEINAFIDLLRRYDIAALVDTRSQPYSRYNQHFSREHLKYSLEEAGIEYFYLGKELAGRPEDGGFNFKNGKVDYDLSLNHHSIWKASSGCWRWRRIVALLLCAPRLITKAATAIG